ncbi:N-acetylgalactosamine kinase-like [Lytechinus pictus]|uniref:N-acetylgalactosamine kinase-like n=1 Tax=Lytechinus pictus TaxID=7653 RepID=UPI0030B9DD54
MEGINHGDKPPIIAEIPLFQRKRTDDLFASFENKYKKKPLFLARASGRVNLIGEHIDYCGYSVLPMAIEQDILMAVATNTNTELHLSNANSKFSDFVTDMTSFTIDQSRPEWHNYILCGIKGILERAGMVDTPQGMSIMVDGNVPKSAGLSSSSALVCCAGLATKHAHSLAFTKTELADICMRCEHYIGTQGGGMDQSICFLAKAGTAKHIEFNPIRAHDVSLPEGVVFVVANSCVELQKASTSHFNIRVVECRLASQILAKSKGLEWRKMRRLADVEKALGVSLSDMEEMVDQVLHPEPYTKDEVCGILSLSTDELNSESLSQNTLHVQSFKLHNRAMHVFSEANRVLKFKALCNDSSVKDPAQLLGNLMNDSHASCRDLYECSCPELDELVEICKKAGALGSRLTGAGWAGCTVSMVPNDTLQAFLKQVEDEFYAKDPNRRSKVAESLFATQPGQGAVIYQIHV